MSVVNDTERLVVQMSAMHNKFCMINELCCIHYYQIMYVLNDTSYISGRDLLASRMS